MQGTGPSEEIKSGDGMMSRTQEQIEELISLGCTYEKKETEQGETKSGWWMDTVFLAPYKMPGLALSIIKG